MVSKNKKTKLSVYGMTCSSCEGKVELALKKIGGVKKVKADVKKNEVELLHNNADLGLVKKTIRKLGYSLNKVNATRQGLLFGLIPHVGCIAFIIAAIVGASFFMNLFRPLLLSSYFFYALIGFSLVFATLSAIVYLKKNGFLNFEGIKRQKKYLATLYGITISVNLVLFLLIFPLSANFVSAGSSSANEDSGVVELEVIIPCSGHAPLIINEVSQEEGVQEVKYSFPYSFTVKFDKDVTSPDKILLADIFDEFEGSYDEDVFVQLNDLSLEQNLCSGSCSGSCNEQCGGVCEGNCNDFNGCFY